MPSLPGKAGEFARRTKGFLTAPQHRVQVLVASGVIVAAVGVSLGLVLTSGSTPPKRASAPPPSSSTTTTSPAAVVSSRCPLTDAPPPNGTVPHRAALLVKVGNEPDGARPQSGLNEADIVFDTPAEGFIMRYVAVFQCQNAASIGPTRSVRWVDWNMVARQFVTPILAFAGGIDPNVNGVAAQPWLSGANLLEGAQEAGQRISSRVPPDNLYTSTSSLYALFKSKTTPPSPIFDYSAALPSGATPAASIGIDFSAGTDALWKWDGTTHQWLHTYSGVPDIDVLTNKQVTTTNIVIEVVHYTIGPYCESGCPGGSGDVESQLVGSGTGYVARNGTAVKVTWHRPTELSKSTFTNANGQEVKLAPGRTWVELIPDTQADAPGGITVTP